MGSAESKANVKRMASNLKSLHSTLIEKVSSSHAFRRHLSTFQSSRSLLLSLPAFFNKDFLIFWIEYHQHVPKPLCLNDGGWRKTSFRNQRSGRLLRRTQRCWWILPQVSRNSSSRRYFCSQGFTSSYRSCHQNLDSMRAVWLWLSFFFCSTSVGPSGFALVSRFIFFLFLYLIFHGRIHSTLLFLSCLFCSDSSRFLHWRQWTRAFFLESDPHCHIPELFLCKYVKLTEEGDLNGKRTEACTCEDHLCLLSLIQSIIIQARHGFPKRMAAVIEVSFYTDNQSKVSSKSLTCLTLLSSLSTFHSLIAMVESSPIESSPLAQTRTETLYQKNWELSSMRNSKKEPLILLTGPTCNWKGEQVPPSILASQVSTNHWHPKALISLKRISTQQLISIPQEEETILGRFWFWFWFWSKWEFQSPELSRWRCQIQKSKEVWEGTKRLFERARWTWSWKFFGQ